jgi:acetyl-CoA C-acetyltransferase
LTFILDAVRTPRARAKISKGALAGVHPQELFAQVLRALERRGSVDPVAVDDVAVGCVSQVGDQGANIGRAAVLAAGWPHTVSALSLDRMCGSGLQAVHVGAGAIAAGAADLIVAGGVESMSRVPMGADGGGLDGNNQRLRAAVPQVPQGVSADLIATIEGYAREQLDAIGLRSQHRAARATREGRFARSLVPVVDPDTGATLLDSDDTPRPDTTASALAALPPAFAALGEAFRDQLAAARPNHPVRPLHTAGTSSVIADGAAAVVLASASYVRERGLRPRARIRAMATVGSDPLLMLTGPAPASRAALRRAGLNPSDVDVWEINEAFAVVVLHTIRELGRSRQPERRRHRARTSARRHRRDVARHSPRRARAHGFGDGAGHALHRRRPGHRDRHRTRR